MASYWLAKVYFIKQGASEQNMIEIRACYNIQMFVHLSNIR